MNIMSFAHLYLSGYPFVLPYVFISLHILNGSQHLLLKGERFGFKYPFGDLESSLNQCFPSPFFRGACVSTIRSASVFQSGTKALLLMFSPLPSLQSLLQPFLINYLELFRSLCLSLLSLLFSLIAPLLCLFLGLFNILS